MGDKKWTYQFQREIELQTAIWICADDTPSMKVKRPVVKNIVAVFFVINVYLCVMIH
jgi:hypothetical protein